MLGNLVKDGITGLMTGLDGLFTNDEQRIKANAIARQIETDLITGLMAHDAKLAEMQARVVEAEAKGESVLQRNWRPIVMLTFVALVVARWLGFTAPDMSPEEYIAIYGIIELGLGGYVIGRSAEKSLKAWLESKRAENTLTAPGK